ncbi:5-methylcytosine-specific restriction enzyme B [Thermoflavimicrobium dichotomicum]|uniref:5-methylcytosine-specific restriction enzyme B n=1 Tax=Thermoflavimicrobium dichotomicum TaxID=46223 RepID=A0A1I3QHF7_9BACL|nr:5-methylcytosine-specific restriction enzyme B [Thermoflavimicrobium dichotomicum]
MEKMESSLATKDWNKQEKLGHPFHEVFHHVEVAEWAFECMKDLSDKLQVYSEEDERIAITYRKDKKGIHYQFGNWLLLGFYGGKDQPVARIPIMVEKLKSLDSEVEYKVEYEFKTDPKVVSVSFSLATLEQVGDEILSLYDQTIDAISQMLSNCKKSTHRHKHNESLGKAVFDPTYRKQLFYLGL